MLSYIDVIHIKKERVREREKERERERKLRNLLLKD